MAPHLSENEHQIKKASKKNKFLEILRQQIKIWARYPYI